MRGTQCLEMTTLVVTGGIGCGKSLVCRYLSSKGVPVYDADSRTKRLYDVYPELVEEIEDEFCCFLRSDDGRLDRKALAAIVFSDSEKLKALEDIVHPYVYRDFEMWRDSVGKEVPFVVMESAIFQSKPLFKPLADKVLLVEAPAGIRLQRALHRDSSSEEEILSRMREQHFRPEEADAIIINDSDKDSLYLKIDEALGKMGLTTI